MTYLVIELQKAADGTVSNIVTAYESLSAAESHFYTVLAAAAVSSLPVHSAVLVNDEGYPVKRECFKHYPEEEENG